MQRQLHRDCSPQKLSSRYIHKHDLQPRASHTCSNTGCLHLCKACRRLHERMDQDHIARLRRVCSSSARLSVPLLRPTRTGIRLTSRRRLPVYGRLRMAQIGWHAHSRHPRRCRHANKEDRLSVLEHHSALLRSERGQITVYMQVAPHRLQCCHLQSVHFQVWRSHALY